MPPGKFITGITQIRRDLYRSSSLASCCLLGCLFCWSSPQSILLWLWVMRCLQTQYSTKSESRPSQQGEYLMFLAFFVCVYVLFMIAPTFSLLLRCLLMLSAPCLCFDSNETVNFLSPMCSDTMETFLIYFFHIICSFYGMEWLCASLDLCWSTSYGFVTLQNSLQMHCISDGKHILSPT